METSRTRILDDEDDSDLDENEQDLKGQRRKVTLDPGQLDDLLNFSDENDDECSEFDQLSRQGSIDSILSQDNNNGLDKASPKKKGHQRRHSLTVCETPDLKSLGGTKPRKPPQIVFETQMSNISTTTLSSSGSVTPTSDPGTPKIEANDGLDDESPALAEDSIAQMQARLHAEFMQSVS